MFAVVFPGQGSQKPGMGKDFFDHGQVTRSVFQQVSEAVNADVARLCFEADDETLRQTQNAQIALYTCGVAGWKELETRVGKPAAFAGHSIGEYAALTAAGVLSLEDGAKLVKRRGELMAASGFERPGTMAAVLGMERDALATVCAEASTDDSIAVIANDNCPGQLVISGDIEAVKRAGELATAGGAKRVLPLNVSGAFHSPLMDNAAAKMAEALAEAAFGEDATPVISNVTASAVSESTEWPKLLGKQLMSPVRWTESVQAMRSMGIEKFIECGSGEVLCGLIRRIDKEAATSAVTDWESLGKVEGI